MTAPNRQRPGFTIVEILVVISVLVALVALLLPALSGATKRARKGEELNHLRQIGVGWNLYAQSNRDSALPGFLDSTNLSPPVPPDPNGDPGPPPQTVQQRWKVQYKYADGSRALADDAEEWPWRLLQYLEFADELVLGHLDLDSTGPQAMSDTREEDPYGDYLVHRNTRVARTTHIAEEPTFAYNGFYVGGWYGGEIDKGEWLPVEDADDTIVGYHPLPRFGSKVTAYYKEDGAGTDTPYDASVVARSPAQIRNSSGLILFCSASRMPVGEFHEVEDNRFGSHIVVPPYLARTAMWRKSKEYSSDNTIEVRDRLDGQDAPVPVGRHTGSVATIRADLHTEASAPGVLDDQRLWIDEADRAVWIHEED